LDAKTPPQGVTIARDLTDLKYAPLTEADHEKYQLVRGDILFNRTNSKELVGKTGIWDGRMDAVAASYFIRLRVVSERTDPWFLWAFFNTRHMKQRLFETARGAIGQSNINAKEVRAFSVPEPPLQLQHAFAERVSDLQSIIAQQDRMATASEQMADALMAKVFEGGVEQDGNEEEKRMSKQPPLNPKPTERNADPELDIFARLARVRPPMAPDGPGKVAKEEDSSAS
jgi:hypothetical protein